MDLQDFKDWALNQGTVAKYNDGQFPGQCVSLINQYCYRVLGVPAGSWGNAVNWASDSNANRAYFDKVSSPEVGDIGIMGTNYGGGYGHIFIYLSPSTILEQNGRTALKITTGGTYPNPIAILRHKGEDVSARNLTKEEVTQYYTQVVPGRPVDDGFVQAWTGQDLGAMLRYVAADPSINGYIQSLLNPADPGYTPVSEQLFRKKG